MLLAYLIGWIAAIVGILVLDGIWLGLLARSFYTGQMGGLMRSDVRIAPAAGFYLCYALGLVFLAVRPGASGVSLGNVALYGAVVGFLAYGTYNMTTLAVVRDWPTALSFVDLVWGTVMSSVVAVSAALAVRHFA